MGEKMGRESKIEWTDSTWNPIVGCSRVSEGCRNCYAAHLMATRLKYHPIGRNLAGISALSGVAQFNGTVRFISNVLDDPLNWKRSRRIFVCSHGDLFHENVRDEWIDKVFAVMALSPQHIFQVLTKRPERMLEYVEHYYLGSRVDVSYFSRFGIVPSSCYGRPVPLLNVWLGVSIEDQKTADARIPVLLHTKASKRFISAEPLLGPISIEAYMPNSLWNDLPMWKGEELDWVIAGGESGKNARIMKIEWLRSIRDQCVSAHVPFFFKQWGVWLYSGVGDIYQKFSRKKGAGRVLDGVTWDEVPFIKPMGEGAL